MTVVLLAAIELGAGFLVAERSAPAPTPEIPGDTVSRTLAWLEINPAPLVRDVDLLWRNEPGARKTQPVNPQPFGHDDSWTIENNTEGLRGPERVPAAAADSGVYRILCIGDSITFGFNVDQPDAYPRQLQRLLEGRYPARRFELVNGGVPGWTWLQGLRFLELRGLAMRPDLVIMGHGTNDQFLPAKVTDDERFHRLAGPGAKLMQSMGLLLTNTNSYRVVERFFPPPPFSPDADSPSCKAQIERGGACHRVSVDEIAAAVAEVQRLVVAHHSALLLVNLDFVETPAVDGMRRTADREALPLIDAVDHLRGLRRRDEDARAAHLGLAPASAPSVGSAPRARPKRLVLRVLAPDGRATYQVRGTGQYRPEFTFAESVYDDGTHGDERSGDGVYSTTVTVPAMMANVQYLFHRNDEPEIRSLPPLASSMGDRLVPVPDDAIAPVDVFGESLFMAERAHPNREGQQIVATLAADRLETFPSFRRFVDAEPGGDGAPEPGASGS